MPSDGYLASAVATAAVITFALRALPFAFLGRLRSSQATAYLARHLPAGLMVILVVHLLQDVPVTRSPYGLREATALTVTAALHLRRRTVLLSIALGTTTYILLPHLPQLLPG